jgi:hypothetical protein
LQNQQITGSCPTNGKPKSKIFESVENEISMETNSFVNTMMLKILEHKKFIDNKGKREYLTLDIKELRKILDISYRVGRADESLSFFQKTDTAMKLDTLSNQVN